MARHRRRRPLPRLLPGLVPSALRTVVAAALVLVVSSAAFAYWATTGRGSAAASSGSTATLTISSGTPTATLYPGGTAAVTTVIANSGSADVRVSSISLATAEGTGGFDVDSGHGSCGLDSLSFATQTTGWTVPAGGSVTLSLTGALAMSTDADDECQGASYTVHLKVAS